MAHQWQEWSDLGKTPAQLFMSEPQRRCERCGSIQTRTTEYLWMRVRGYRWLPRVGRCKPANSN